MFLKNLLCIALSLQLGHLAFAQPPNTPSKKISAEEAESLFVEGTFRYVAMQSQFNRTPAQFEKFFLKDWTAADRQTFETLTKGVTQLPVLHATKNSLFAVSNKTQVRFELVNREKGQFKVNGMLWTYDPKASLRDQLKILQAHLPTGPSSAGFLRHALFPEAQAIEPFTTILISVVLTAAVTSIINNGLMDPIFRMISSAFCSSFENGLGVKMSNYELCDQWEEKRNKDQRRNSPQMDAIKKLKASDQSEVLAKFEVQREYACPDNNDKKERIYKGKVKLKSGQMVMITAKWNAEGDATSILVEDPQTRTEMAKINFDADSYMTGADIPNPDAERATSLAPDKVPLREGQKMTPDEEAKLSLLKDIALFVNLRVIKCSAQSADGDADAKGTNPLKRGPVLAAPIGATQNQAHP